MDEFEERIKEWYPQAKVYFDGSHYVAIPHKENKCRRRKPNHEVITVSEEGGKLQLERSPLESCEVFDDEGDNPFDSPELFGAPVSLEEAIAKGTAERKDDPPVLSTPPKAKRKTTRKEIFDELYSRYIQLSRKKKREVILSEMLPLFKLPEAAETFVDNNLERKRRNVVARRKRFVRKAFNQKFNYFATFTYADGKHNEESFMKKLKQALQNFVKRKGWKYMGVWERGKKTNRLHFHALVYVPGGLAEKDCVKKEVYSFKRHQRKTVMQSKFFADRFGQNDFEELDQSALFGHALGYLMKYMEKTEEKIVCSKGLYQYFVTDLMGDDVLAFCGMEDHKLVLADDFNCWEEGVLLGTVSPETIAQLPKSN